MKNSRTLFLTRGAMIAAGYVVLTYLTHLVGLDSGAIQFRISEALTVLPVFFAEAIPGLFIGCALSNLLCGGTVLDILFGSLATLLGALGTYALRRMPMLASIPPIIANVLIIPPVLIYAYGATEALPYLMLTVGLGEVVCAGVLGTILILTDKKYKKTR